MHIDMPHCVMWQKLESTDGWSDDAHSEASEIPARIERRSRVRQSASSGGGAGGEERIDETRILVGHEHLVQTGDLLDGERVEATDEQVNLSGEVVGRICYLEGR